MEHIGQRSIQSVMRMSTQSNLSSFHSAGIASVSKRSPSIQEILDYPKKMSSSMTFRFIRGTTRHQALSCRPMIVQISMIKLIKKITRSTNCYSEETSSDLWIVLSQTDIAQQASRNSSATMDSETIDVSVDYVSIVANGTSMSTIASTISNVFSSNEIANIMYIPEPICIIRLRKSRKSKLSLWNISHMLRRMMIGKKTGVESLTLFESIDGVISAYAEGSDIEAICTLPNIDFTSIVSNDIRDIEKTYGIDAARLSIFSQLNSFHSDENACILLANVLTRSGTVRGFTKYSSEFTDPKSPLFLGFLTSSYVERSKKDIIDSVVKHSVDEMISPYSSQVMGRLVNKKQ